MDRNLEDVDKFYNQKYGVAARRLKLLQERYGTVTDVPKDIDRDEVEELMGALLELRGQLRKLQWYGEVNRRGFIKITKKLDKKVGQPSTQQLYLESKVDPKEFATNLALLETMKSVNDWLAALGDAKVYDDNSSTHSSLSVPRVSSKAILNLPAGPLLETVDQVIRHDEALVLLELMEDTNLGYGDSKEVSFQRLTLNLLQRAISCRAKECIDKLLDHLTTLDEGDDINNRNCIHRLIITIGRSKSGGVGEGAADLSIDAALDTANYITPAAPPILAPPTCVTKELDGVTRLVKEDESVVILQYLLDKLRPEQRVALQTRDAYGRMPLHYAAQYGFVVICQLIMDRMQQWGQFEAIKDIDGPFWQDAEGWAPLHLSVIGGHPLTTKILLNAGDWKAANDRKPTLRKEISKSGEVLALATKSNFVVIVRLLVEAGIDLDYQDDQGETALHVAARFGHTECATALLGGSGNRRANTEIAEKTFSWTPLFVACVDGHLDIVKLLIKAEADLERSDSSGWTAKEHAALRGHMNIAKILAEFTTAPRSYDSDSSTIKSSSPPYSSSLTDRKSNGTNWSNGPVRNTQPIKTFGHRYLTKESMVLVSLGTMDMRKAIEAVKLERIPLADAHSTQLDTALSVVVSASGATGEPSIIDLPVQDNISTDPIVFTALDPTKVKLLFDIVPTYAGSKDQIVGRGVALLSSIKPSIGSKRITLQGDVAVPIMAASTLDVIGSVNFNFLIITPFTHPNMSITENQTYWKSMTSTMVIGHRGDLSLAFLVHVSCLIFAKAWERTWPLEGLYNSEKTLFR